MVIMMSCKQCIDLNQNDILKCDSTHSSSNSIDNMILWFDKLLQYMYNSIYWILIVLIVLGNFLNAIVQIAYNETI